MEGIPACDLIKASSPHLKVVTLVYPRDVAALDDDMRFDRVRVYVGDDGVVAKVPRLG